MRTFTLELEVQDRGSAPGTVFDGRTWVEGAGADQLTISLVGEEAGHGFGLSEVITIAVSVGAGVASDLVADGIRRAVGGVIRRVKGRSGRADGTPEGLRKLVDDELEEPGS